MGDEKDSRIALDELVHYLLDSAVPVQVLRELAYFPSEKGSTMSDLTLRINYHHKISFTKASSVLAALADRGALSIKPGSPPRYYLEDLGSEALDIYAVFEDEARKAHIPEWRKVVKALIGPPLRRGID